MAYSLFGEKPSKMPKSLVYLCGFCVFQKTEILKTFLCIQCFFAEYLRNRPIMVLRKNGKK
jgi:hypothetical protein